MFFFFGKTFFGGRQPFTSRAARWFVRRTILSRALWTIALRVEVEARSNMEAMIGRFDTVSVEFQEMKFEKIQVREKIPGTEKDTHMIPAAGGSVLYVDTGYVQGNCDIVAGCRSPVTGYILHMVSVVRSS